MQAAAKKQQGFALAITIWLLAILLLAAGAFASWVRSSLEQAWSERLAIDGLIDVRSTRNTLLFIAATQPMSSAGFILPEAQEGSTRSLERKLRNNADDPFTSYLPATTGNELSLMSQPYVGIGNARFALQDEAGLLNPMGAQRARLDSFLGLLDVDAGARGPLLDKLADFVSENDLRSLYGANTADYLEAGLPAPPNRYLLSSMEAWWVLEWKGSSAVWREARWREYVTTTAFSGINLNSAPAFILQTDPFINGEDAARIIAERERRPFVSPEDAARRTGLLLSKNLFAFTTFPSSTIRITLWHEGANQGVRYHVTLTPQSDQGVPWEVDSAYPIDEYGLNLDEPRQPESPVFTATTAAGIF